MGTVILQWIFEPADGLEEPIEIEQTHFKLTIGEGTAEAQIDLHTFDQNPAIRQRLNSYVEDQLLAMQIRTHKPYKLSLSQIARDEPGKPRQWIVEPEPVRLVIRAGQPDFRLMDAEGNTIWDSRKERLDGRRSLASLLSEHRLIDPVADVVSRSYNAAVEDPANELVHLYEIREAISKKLGGEVATISALGLTKTEWSRFGVLTNFEPLRQGRHRGKNADNLRDASEAELGEARAFARKMIEAYLRSL